MMSFEPQRANEPKFKVCTLHDHCFSAVETLFQERLDHLEELIKTRHDALGDRITQLHNPVHMETALKPVQNKLENLTEKMASVERRWEGLDSRISILERRIAWFMGAAFMIGALLSIAASTLVPVFRSG